MLRIRIYLLLMMICWPLEVAAFGSFDLGRGLSAQSYQEKRADPPEKIGYDITSRYLPAPVRAIYEVKPLGAGFHLTGEGYFLEESVKAGALFEILTTQMGGRVTFEDGIISFKIESVLDQMRRAEEVQLFGMPVFFEPHDCFAVLGECESFQQGRHGLGKRLQITTTESNGVWRARALNRQTGEVEYTVSYTIDTDGLLMNENRIFFENGRRIRTMTRRIK